jgi:hypothetical protein
MQHLEGLGAMFAQYSNSIYNHIGARDAALPYVYIKVSRKVGLDPGTSVANPAARANSCGTYHLLAGISQCLSQMASDKSGSPRDQYGRHVI